MATSTNNIRPEEEVLDVNQHESEATTIELEELESNGFDERELDERELEPAALVFLTYPLVLVGFAFLVFFVLWYLGWLHHGDPAPVPEEGASISSAQAQLIHLFACGRGGLSHCCVVMQRFLGNAYRGGGFLASK